MLGRSMVFLRFRLSFLVLLFLVFLLLVILLRVMRSFLFFWRMGRRVVVPFGRMPISIFLATLEQLVAILITRLSIRHGHGEDAGEECKGQDF